MDFPAAGQRRWAVSVQLAVQLVAAQLAVSISMWKKARRTEKSWFGMGAVSRAPVDWDLYSWR